MAAISKTLFEYGPFAIVSLPFFYSTSPLSQQLQILLPPLTLAFLPVPLHIVVVIEWVVDSMWEWIYYAILDEQR